MSLNHSVGSLSFLTLGVLSALSTPAHAQTGSIYLSGAGDVRAIFERSPNGYLWKSYEDTTSGTRWTIGGPRISLQTPDGRMTDLAGATSIAL